jgi:hypothetical protein
MNRQLVSSSNLLSVGYDPASQTLEVEFQDGSVYQYYNVGQSMHDQLMAAPSKREIPCISDQALLSIFSCRIGGDIWRVLVSSWRLRIVNLSCATYRNRHNFASVRPC